MIWHEPTNHANDCYFCHTKVFEYSIHSKSRIMYLDSPSALRPITHLLENISIPIPPPVSEQDNNSSSAESIEFSQTSNSSASIASMLRDAELH